MSTHKMIDCICITAVFLVLALTILITVRMTPGIISTASDSLFTTNDLRTDWDASAATKITLSDQGITINGNGACVLDGNVHLLYAGHYILTGQLSDGSVVIDAGKNDQIWILLSGVTLHCEDDAAIRVEQAGKVFLTLAEDTENTVTSGPQYSADAVASGVDGTIYSRDDLTINGNGTLVVDATYHHGIVCNDNLAVTGGNISVNAAQDGIHANDSVRIKEARLSVSAGDDGITVSNDDETAFLYIESGNITIPDCYEGLEAINVTIAGGTIDIRPTDDGINANGSGTDSAIQITGGDITIVNTSGTDADGLDSNGSIYIDGGRVFISVWDGGGNYALDYGSENGGRCVISGGTVIACGSRAMAEGFDKDSPQGFLMCNLSAEAGALIGLQDSMGRELISEEIPCGFSSIVLSMPELKAGDVCTLTVNDEKEQITIDNSTASGFSPVGMSGDGRRNAPEPPGGADFSGGMEPSDDAGFSGGMEPSDDADFSSGMEPPGGADFSGSMEPPDDADFSGGMEPPGGADFSGSMEPPGGADFSDGMEPPENQDSHDNMEPPSRPGMYRDEDGVARPGLRETGGRPFTPDMAEDWRLSQQTSSTEEPASSAIPVDALLLLGISSLALLAGLAVAIKFRH